MSGSVDLLSKTSCSFKILHHCPYQFYEALEQKQKRWQYQSTFTHRTEKLGEVHDRVRVHHVHGPSGLGGGVLVLALQ